MVKVLIYSSKEIYENAPFEGRAEAHIVAYREDEHHYRIIKNRTSRYIPEKIVHFTLHREIEWAERDEWNREKESHDLSERYKTHPITTLMKNEPTDV
jgi:hypothetical protein